ncbi:outer membrane protein assembly factor BamE [Phaeovulum sp.]|uniref:outer membrane protein assembly factor BamE n=1 Tax=Phaeovulum sp. TaxID=2934796 RepID=UPI003569CDA7
MGAACSPVYRNNGYVPTDEDLAKVVVGKTTREQAAAAVGRPSAEGLLEGSAWYYVGSRWKYLGPFAPREVERQVVAISFSTRGIVTNVERFGLEQGEVVTLSRRVTDSNIKGVGFIRQMLGNIGNFDASQFTN